MLGLSSNNDYAQIQLNGDTGAFIDFSDSGVDQKGRILYTHSDNKMAFFTNSGEKMSISSNGNLTISGNVDGRNIAADGSKLDGIESGATADQTASEILTLIKTVDGAGSGLDADLLDGVSSGSFVRTILTDDDITARMNSGFYESSSATTAEGWPVTSNSWYHLISSTHSNTGNYYSMQIAGDFFSQDNFYIRSTNGSGTRAWSEIWTSSSDGSGSGLDADTVDGIQASSFLRSDADDTTSGQLRITYSNIYPLNIDSANNGKIVLQGSNDPYIRFRESATDKAYIQWNSNGFLEINNQETNEGLRIKTGNNGLVFTENGAEYRVFHAGNMGSGSGLDADNLDSLGSHQFVRSDADDTITGSITFSKDAVDVINFSANSTNLNRGIAFNSRTALSAQYNDGWLRINNNSEFTNGVFTPLKIRADQGFHVGGTTIINGNAQVIASRLTGALPAIDGSALTGISAGATGGGSDEVFYENGQTVTTDYTITNGKNAMAAGPITINSGVTVTVGSGENLTIV